MKSLRNTYYLRNSNKEDNEFRVRTPPRKHSPEKLNRNEGYDILCELLEALNLQDEFEKFYKNEVTFFDLHLLSEEDFSDMNISNKSSTLIMQAIQHLKQKIDHNPLSLPTKSKAKPLQIPPNYELLIDKLSALTENLQLLAEILHTQQIEIIDLHRSLSSGLN